MGDSSTKPPENKLGLITDSVDVPSEKPTPQAFAEARDLKRRARLDRIAARRERRGLRRTYAKKLFVLLCAWVSGIYLLLIFQGMGKIGSLSFFLDDKVLMAAIGSTTVNVIGLFYVVAKYLYPDPSRPRSNKTKDRDDA